MSGHIVALSIAFAFGALVMWDANRRHAPECKPVPVAPTIRPAVRETWALSHPLGCEHGWVKNCADFECGPPVCLSVSVQ